MRVAGSARGAAGRHAAQKRALALPAAHYVDIKLHAAMPPLLHTLAINLPAGMLVKVQVRSHRGFRVFFTT